MATRKNSSKGVSKPVAGKPISKKEEKHLEQRRARFLKRADALWEARKTAGLGRPEDLLELYFNHDEICLQVGGALAHIDLLAQVLNDDGLEGLGSNTLMTSVYDIHSRLEKLNEQCKEPFAKADALVAQKAEARHG